MWLCSMGQNLEHTIKMLFKFVMALCINKFDYENSLYVYGFVDFLR